MPMIFQRLGKYALSLCDSYYPWTNVYGLARSILATGTLLTLLFNNPYTLFRPAVGIVDYPVCQGVGTVGVFCLFSPYLEVARWLSIVILLIVISGWRPRYTGMLHWWIAASLQTSAIVLDGGDQVTTVLTLLLLPVTLTDSRKWHWKKNDGKDDNSIFQSYKKLTAISALAAIRFQVSIIYFHAAVAKLSLDEWVDGTILYYWLSDSLIGLPNWLRIILPVFTSKSVVIFTWGTILLETLLFMSLLMPKKNWKYLLIAGISFHAGIALMMGLITFGLAMTAALILYLRPIEHTFDLAFLLKFFRNKDEIPIDLEVVLES